MKAIVFQQFTKPDPVLRVKVYTVSLGPDNCYGFNNEKDVKRFLAESGKYFSFKLLELNECYIDAFRFYREAWFYMDEGRKNNFLQLDHSIPANLSRIEMIFKNILRPGQNQQYCAIARMRDIHNILAETYSRLKQLYETKEMPLQSYRCTAQLQRSGSIIRDLETYGSIYRTKEPAKIITLPSVRMA
jgi:hypothetical protein